MTPKTNGLLLSSVATGCLIASMAGAASHREAPGITQQPKIDNTDFYVFRSYEPGREDYVTMIANFQPIQAPYGGPNYFTMDSDAVYEIHVDNNGDAIEDLTFQFRFDNDLKDDTGIQLDIAGETVAIPLRQAGPITRAEPTAALNETETYTVQLIRGDRRSGTASALSQGGGTTFTKPVDYIGMKTLPDYDAYADLYMYDDVAIDGCDAPGRVFAGQRAEAFAINLGEVFDLINLVPIQGDSSDNDEDDAYPQYDVANPFPGGITQDRDNDDLIDEANITSLAIEVPIACLTSDGEPVIGAWSTSSLPQAEIEDPSPTYEQTSRYGGAFVQQSRLGAPLVNEVVIGLPDKDLFNAAEPMQDGALAVYVTNPTLPALIDALFRDAVGADGNIAPTNFPANRPRRHVPDRLHGLQRFLGRRQRRGGDVAAEHRRAADPDRRAASVRRHRRGSGRVPEWSPAGRRCHRRRAAGGHGAALPPGAAGSGARRRGRHGGHRHRPDQPRVLHT